MTVETSQSRILQFQGHPLELAHESRVKALLAPFEPKTLRDCSSAWLRLKSFAERQWDVIPVPFDFQNQPLGDLILLDPMKCLYIADWLGALAYYHVIRKTVKGDILTALKHNLPHVYPELLRLAKHFQPWLDKLNATVKESSITPMLLRQHGLSILSIIWTSLPPPIWKRWRLQFPEQPLENLPAVIWNPEQNDDDALLHEILQRCLTANS